MGWWPRLGGGDGSAAVTAGTVATAVEGEQAAQAEEGIEEKIVISPPIVIRGEVNSQQVRAGGPATGGS